MLNREDILACDDLSKEPVHVPEWQCTLYVRVMTGQEMAWLRSTWLTADGELLPAQERTRHTRANLVALTACHADGSSLFTLADVPALELKSATALDRIADVASRLNKLRDEDVEDTVKNSVTTSGGASGSDLLPT